MCNWLKAGLNPVYTNINLNTWITIKAHRHIFDSDSFWGEGQSEQMCFKVWFGGRQKCPSLDILRERDTGWTNGTEELRVVRHSWEGIQDVLWGNKERKLFENWCNLLRRLYIWSREGWIVEPSIWQLWSVLIWFQLRGAHFYSY